MLALAALLVFAPIDTGSASVDLPVLDGGDFAGGVNPELRRIPWWRTVAGEPRVEFGDGGPELVLDAGAAVEQPFALLGDSPFQIRGFHAGAGSVVLIDGAGGSVTFPLDSNAVEPVAFAFDRAEFEGLLGRAATPRFTLRLVGPESGAPARWSNLDVRASTPAREPAGLRAELVRRIDGLVVPYFERGLDTFGPRTTAFIAQFFDADTGAPTGGPLPRVGYSPLYDRLLAAYREEPREEWRAPLAAFIADFLELCLHPQTGLPRTWDPVADRPADDEPLEIAIHLRFLLDAALHGPPELRARCRAAAARIGEWVLARGVLPTGEIAPKYRPRDGQPFTETAPLRRLDVPAQLARLGAVLGDTRHRIAAREAVRVLEYAHHWPGTWDRIDPGFDDDYGHYGERAVTMWEAWPDEPAFRDLALSGWHTFAPLWRLAVRHGGNIAADQVRCWRIAERIARLEPGLGDEIAALVDEAARLHFKGGQGADGVWVDVTIFGFDPQRLPVGDTAGVPHNLLEGLGVAHDARLGLDTAETRARFEATLLATDRAFGGPYGYISGSRRAVGAGAANPAIGSIRLLPALVDLLERLPR